MSKDIFEPLTQGFSILCFTKRANFQYKRAGGILKFELGKRLGMLTAGLEPATKKGQILNLLCLPISPSKRKTPYTLRDRRIRTPDKLHPKQPRYQTAPYPEVMKYSN